MTDWEDDLKKVAARVEKDKKDQEEFDNQQQMLNSQSPNIWAKAVASINEFVAMAKKDYGDHLLTFTTTDPGDSASVSVTYTPRNTIRQSSLKWNKKIHSVTMP